MGEPTFQDVAFGDHERDVVDLYQEEDQGAIQARFYRETVEFLKRQFEMG